MDSQSEGEKIIRAMSRTDFHRKIIRGVCRTAAFGHLVSAGAEDLTPAEKAQVRDALAAAGLPRSCMESDPDLSLIAFAIAGRSVTLN